MLLFVMPDHVSPLSFLAWMWERAVATVHFPVAGYQGFRKSMANHQKVNFAQKHFSAIGAEFDNLET